MTDQSNSAVGRAAIDAYLDSVDEALIAAHAPRSDRMQVLQDLESQITDMLSQQPQPLTEEAVQAVIKTLEPPSHFAATYGNGKRPAPSTPGTYARVPKIRWPLASAISAGLLPIVCLLLLCILVTHPHSEVGAWTFWLMFFVGCVFTPFALSKARKQLLAGEAPPADRNLFVKALIVYGTFAPPLLAVLAALITRGVVLIPFSVVAFVYIQYVIIRRVCGYMTDGMPQPAPSPSTAVSNGSNIASALTPAGS